MPEPITAKERATKFVNNHPMMFTEDFDWWIAEIALMIIEAEKAQLEADRVMALKVIGEARS